MADVAEQQWATLSFVPEDLVWFDWIIRETEGYPVPGGLAGASTRFGFDLPSKLTLFPDRWNPLNFEGYPTALESSRFLIVVVSPNSAKSPWVEDQMQAFRNSGGEERIIALVVDGRPDGVGTNVPGDWLPDWLATRMGESGFSPAGSTEPIVIDARGGAEKLAKARESLLASLLTTTCQELERMGGLTPPLDLSQSTAAPVAPEPAVEVQPVTSVRNAPRFSWKSRSIAASAALFFFGSGWMVGHLMTSAPAPDPVVVSHKHRSTASGAAEVSGTAPEPVATTAPQNAKASTTDEPTPAPNAAPADRAEETADSPPLVSEAPSGESKSAELGNSAVAPSQNSGVSTSQNPDPSPVSNARITSIVETVALPKPVPAAPIAAPTSEPAAASAIVPTSKPAVSATPKLESYARLTPVAETQLSIPQTPPPAQIGATEQAERERIEREQRRRDDEALRAQWLSQVAAGDMALRKGKMVQATDFYNAAISTAERYAARRRDDVSSLTEMASLCRKLGAMQVQTASIGEARATYERGRKFLALVKSNGQLSASHAQMLQELETGLQTLPRE
jgi:hypothetical protein